uniref:Uncharacterized protein n=1 Tax=Anguilla anguilla TaxID=7936 RepID=A0A0E9QTF3_ANGAN
MSSRTLVRLSVSNQCSVSSMYESISIAIHPHLRMSIN